jgi:quinol monooxygenase YgiN
LLAFATSWLAWNEIRELSDGFEREIPDAPGLVGLKVLKDRGQDDRFMIIAEFENYEVATENSAPPETDAFARQIAGVLDGPPEYGNGDVIDERSR